MSDTLAMNSLNLGVSPKVGESVFCPPSQNAVKKVVAENATEMPAMPDTTGLTEDKTYKLKWNNTAKVFEWIEG